MKHCKAVKISQSHLYPTARCLTSIMSTQEAKRKKYTHRTIPFHTVQNWQYLGEEGGGGDQERMKEVSEIL